MTSSILGFKKLACDCYDGFRAYKIIMDEGLERVLKHSISRSSFYQGYEIVLSCYASGDDKDYNEILDPYLKSNGSPASSAGNAMIIVGYNRTKQYFIIKNSWDTTWDTMVRATSITTL